MRTSDSAEYLEAWSEANDSDDLGTDTRYLLSFAVCCLLTINTSDFPAISRGSRTNLVPVFPRTLLDKAFLTTKKGSIPLGILILSKHLHDNHLFMDRRRRNEKPNLILALRPSYGVHRTRLM